MKNNLKGSILLLLTALVWGASFVAQSVGSDKVQAFTYNGVRTIIGALVLFPFVLVKNVKDNKLKPIQEKKPLFTKYEIIAGIVLGIIFCFASNFQQVAFYHSGAGKIAFITALYMFFVPIIGLVLGKRVSFIVWISVVIAFIGLYFLCINPNDVGAINLGDVFAFICSIFFAFHILAIDKFNKNIDGVKLSFMQFFVSGTISIIIAFIFETPNVNSLVDAYLPILYSGVMSCGVAYTLQIIGQKYTESTLASIIMSLESVFAVITAWIIIGEGLQVREIIGCAIMFFAIILAQLSDLILTKIKGKSII